VTCPTVLACAGTLALAALAGGCARGEIEVPASQPTEHSGAKLFYQRCSGCHSLEAANAYGSKPPGQIQPGERTNGPDFNTRHVKRDDVLFAIRNGGFSGAIMPANIVVGQNAEKVAAFLDKYSGSNASGNQTNPGLENQP
jgi:mono/diheme cytochrome c family protein